MTKNNLTDDKSLVAVYLKDSNFFKAVEILLLHYHYKYDTKKDTNYKSYLVIDKKNKVYFFENTTQTKNLLVYDNISEVVRFLDKEENIKEVTIKLYIDLNDYTDVPDTEKDITELIWNMINHQTDFPKKSHIKIAGIIQATEK